MLRATLRSFFAHKGRMLLSALAVLLSVAFVAGSLIFSDTVNRTFDRLFASTAADVSVEPRSEFGERANLPSGRIPTVPADLRDRVAAVDGVARADIEVDAENVTVIDADNERVGSSTGAPSIAVNWYVSDRSPVELSDGRAPHGDGEALIDKDTADRHNVAIGDRLRIIAAPGTFPVDIVGITTFTTTNPGATLVFLDTPAAQTRLLDDKDAATAIAVEASPGVSDAELKRRVAAELGDDYTYKTADEQAESAAAELGTFLDIIKYVMLGFAGVAVLVGIFLIVNTFSMLIAQRTRELGLLRALGADRRQVRRSVLAEALLLGLVGATLGLVSGIALAYGLIKLMGVFGMHLDAAEMQVRWVTPVAAYAVGIGVTLMAALLPALRAAKVSPMAALADAEATGTGRPLRNRAFAGLAVAVLGALALGGSAASGELSQASSLLLLGVVLTLVATVVAGPLLVRPVIRVLGAAFPRIFGPVGRMSQRNALRNPRRTGATASALMVGLALVTGMSIAGASMTASFDEEIDKALGADFVVQNENFAPFPQEITEKVRQVEGAGTVVRQRYAPLRLTLPDGTTVRTTGAAADPELDEVIDVEYAAGDSAAALAPGRVGMDKRFADRHGLRIGSRVEAAFITGKRADLTVGALTRDDAGGGPGAEGGVLIGLGTLERYQPGGQEAALLVNAAAGTDVQQLREGLEKTLAGFPQVQVRDLADYKELIREQIAVLLYLVYALLGLAIIIAVLGVVNTLALSVVERTRELGLLRAIGLSRRQLRRMIRLESVVIAVFGAVLGLGLGLVWGLAVQRVLALEGMTTLAIPWSTVIAVVIGSVVVGLVAALLPALRASRMNVLGAIAHE
ncbi:ABC transporter permease [Streptomyces gobiensis]|uniref:ABC transporter permease n=1 Tax=Streptomyces gobiensis TaxID=2875706 RepID=UPI001E62AA31|nr:ABC transporter permease [Streptomyces gobiensis]UGY94864.1 ABC transporter permease [Streptomyces gobiensis]